MPAGRATDRSHLLALALAFTLAWCVVPAPPVAASVPALDVPPPEECRVERRSAADLAELAAAPAPASPAASPTAGFEPPPGDPISAETVAAITATQREVLACVHAGDRVRVFSLFTEELVRRALAEAAAEGLSPEELHARATPPRAADPADRTRLLAIRQGRRLPDGRVGAFVDLAPAQNPQLIEVDFVWYEFVDGRWLIDDLIVVETIDLAATPPAAVEGRREPPPSPAHRRQKAHHGFSSPAPDPGRGVIASRNSP